MLTIADQLLGRAPKINTSGRTIIRDDAAASVNANLMAGAERARNQRSADVTERTLLLLRTHYIDRVFCHNHVISERLNGRSLGRSVLWRIIGNMVDSGELKQVHRDGMRRYFAFSSNTNPDIASAIVEQRVQQKAKRISAGNIIRNWPSAKKGFTHYQAKNMLGERYAELAIADLMAAGELECKTERYNNGELRRRVYTLKAQA